MRRIAPLFVIAGVIFCACAKETALPNRCAFALVEYARSYNLTANTRANHATIEGCDLSIEAKVEQEVRDGNRWIVGVVVTAYTAARDTLIAGSVGVGTTQGDALDTAISEWVKLAGIALIRSCALKERARERHVFPSAVVYPGLTLVRGLEQIPWSKESQTSLLEVLMPALGTFKPNTLHALSLTLEVDPSGSVQGECRVDGTLSAPVLEAARTFAWPRLGTPYMFKQYYVLEGRAA